VEWERILVAVLAGLTPVLPQLIGIAALVIVLGCPMPGRGPRMFQAQDPWRLFKYEARRVVMSRAGNRCEGSAFLAWGRCSEVAAEADHVYPWTRGGPTTMRNGQALCRGHNRRKAAMRPPWWYLLALEHRRRSYFPSGTDVRVTASMSAAEREAHTNALQRKPTP